MTTTRSNSDKRADAIRRMEALKAACLDRVDLVEVIRSYGVELKKAGAEYKACCPFHNEKTPSFTVTPSTQKYLCFGCRKGGDVFQFVMDYQQLEFKDALLEVAESVGLALEEPGDQAPDPHEELYAALEASVGYYREELKKRPDVLEYLYSRGVDDQLIADYRIGFAPARGLDVNRSMRVSSPQVWLDAGILQPGSKTPTPYPVMRERIVFPITNSRDRVIAYGGRAFGECKGPKYLNTPETAIYQKGREVFGLSRAKRLKPKLGVIAVEGYFDALSLVKAGYAGVCTGGSSITPGQAEKIFRLTDELIVGMDPDEAGRLGNRRSVENALAAITPGKSIRIATWPDGRDVDETLLTEAGAEKIAGAVRDAAFASTYLMNELLPKGEGSALEERAKAGRELADIAAVMKPCPLKDLLDKKSQELMGKVASEVPRSSAAAPAPRKGRSPIQLFLAGALASVDVRLAPWFDPASLHESIRPVADFLRNRFGEEEELLACAEGEVQSVLNAVSGLGAQIEIEGVEAAYWRAVLANFSEIAAIGVHDQIWDRIRSAQARLDELEGNGW